MPFHELPVQFNISTEWNVQEVSCNYRLSFNGTEYFLMWR